MSFMSSLASNPSGSIASQPSPDQDPLGLVNNIKDREMRDYQNKANFMADLSLKQDRLRKVYGLDGSGGGQQNNPGVDPNQPSQGMTPGQPGQINPAQQADLALKQRGLDIESQKVAQSGKMGQEALDIKTQQEQLNQQKSDSIHQQKQAELEAKTNEANGKLAQAQAALEAKTKAGEDTLQAHKDLAAAVEERHKLEIDNLNHKFEVTSGQHAQQIKDLEQKAKDAQNRTVQTTVNPEGTERTVRTKSGSAAQNVIKTNPNGTLHVTGPGGKEFDIPPDKLDHWNSTVMGGSESEQTPPEKE